MSPNRHHLCRSHRSLEKVNHLPQSWPRVVQESNEDTDLRENARDLEIWLLPNGKGEKVTRIARINRSLCLFTVTETCLGSTLDLEVSIISLLQSHCSKKEKFCLWWHLVCFTVLWLMMDMLNMTHQYALYSLNSSDWHAAGLLRAAMQMQRRTKHS